MLKTRLILVVVSVVLIAGLFLLPKVVVENDDTISQNSPADSVASTMDMHAQVPASVTEAITRLRAKISTTVEKEKNAIFADSLANLYQSAGKFDSAAWFAEEASVFFNDQASRIKAGDFYYQAYTFALDAAKQKELAKKARSLFEVVLEEDPTNLDAKTKMAMTFLSEPNPMQGILMLRDVLAQDPKNELALYNMGMLSIQSGQYDKAAERLEELVKINPNHTQAHLLLGIAWMNTGKKEEARAQFEKVKLLDKDPSVQATVDSYLKDLK